jgi:hypothetical protein
MSITLSKFTHGRSRAVKRVRIVRAIGIIFGLMVLSTPGTMSRIWLAAGSRNV